MLNEQEKEKWWIRQYNRQVCSKFKPTKNKYAVYFLRELPKSIQHNGYMFETKPEYREEDKLYVTF